MASPGRAFNVCAVLVLVVLLCDVSNTAKYIRIIDDDRHEFECEMNSAYARTASFSVEATGGSDSDAVLTKEHLALCSPNITELSLEGAVVEIQPDALEATPLLEYFEIEGANIVELKPDQFKSLPNIREFEFTLPLLRKVGDGVLSSALYVTLISGGANYITEGVFSGAARIRELVLAGNFTTIPPRSFANMDRLTKLEIKNSSISEFSARLLLSGSDNVDELTLRNNKITSLNEDSFYGLRRLEQLDLTGNLITDLGTDIFATNTKLFQVLLGNNRIAYIGEATFSTVPLLNLNILDLTFNHLYFIEPRVFRQLPGLKGVSVVGNPFKCNCLDELRKWFVESNVQEISCEKFYDGKHPACVAAKCNDCACAPNGTSDEDYLWLYRGQFEPEEISDLATGCQSEIYVFSKDL